MIGPGTFIIIRPFELPAPAPSSQAEKVDGGLVADIEKELHDCFTRIIAQGRPEADLAFELGERISKILLRYTPTKAAKVEEPLALLADRKGMYIVLIKECKYPVGWLIHLQYKITPYDKFSLYEIPGKDDDNVCTYAECEKLARQFLESLPYPVKGNQQDKGEGK